MFIRTLVLLTGIFACTLSILQEDLLYSATGYVAGIFTTLYGVTLLSDYYRDYRSFEKFWAQHKPILVNLSPHEVAKYVYKY